VFPHLGQTHPLLPRLPFLPSKNQYWAFGQIHYRTLSNHSQYVYLFAFRTLVIPAKVSFAIQQWAPLLSDQLTKWITNRTPTRLFPRAITPVLALPLPPKSRSRRRRNEREKGIIAESPLTTSSHPTSSQMRLLRTSTKNGDDCARNLSSFP